MKISLFAFSVAVCVSLPASADTMRCGSSLIAEGATQGEVLQKCGEPDSRTEIAEPVYATRPNGTTYVVGTTTQQVWRYQRRSGQFPANLTFESGVLKKLEFEK
ncbi:MAG TPA: DUF2845 domain-containing protein [Steroidobacteraceae bacterium]|jgi:hypothetical protein